jgi:acetyl esterase/lipase
MAGDWISRLRVRGVRAVLLLVAAIASLTTLAAHEPPALPDDPALVASQPSQPTDGPGSSDYPHAAVRTSKHSVGAKQYWIFTPDDPKPVRAPVIVFLHGWASFEPDAYAAWIKHLVRRGNIVIYPRYQESLRSVPKEFADNAVVAIREAIARLRSGDIQPDLERLAFVGHSMGAIMSANIAQHASRLELPTPRALFLAEPSFEPIVGNYDQVHPSTLLVVAVGADVKRDSSARKILRGSTLVPTENKNFVALPSDVHGNPPIISDHFAPCAADSTGASATKSPRNEWRGRTRDTLDYYGYWKLCDGLLDAAFFDRNREYALSDSPELRFMGLWSDGTPVREATVLDFDDKPNTAAR